MKYRTLDPVRALNEPIDSGLILVLYYLVTSHIPTIIVGVGGVGGVGGMQMQRLKIISEYGVGGKFLNKASFLYKLKCFISRI